MARGVNKVILIGNLFSSFCQFAVIPNSIPSGGFTPTQGYR